jgi:trans-2,3-dihydro-3-hydroxyanthranilate isomerase
MRRRFVTLDVFTDRRFAGNPLAVVLEPEGLDNAAMQAIAREFNLSETVFVLPPAESRHRARLRIFTPSNELPFAGHPTVGTAVLLGAIRDAAEACDIVLEEGIGPVRCRVEPLGSGCGFACFDLPKLAQEVGAAAASGLIATALGLEPDDIGFDGYVPAKWSAGNEFTFIPVRGRDAIQRSRPNLDRWEAAFGNVSAPSYSAESRSRQTTHFTRACLHPAWAFARIRRPARRWPRWPEWLPAALAMASTSLGSSRATKWVVRA